MKQTYRDFLEESTNVVKSNERKSKLILSLTVLGIWALSLIAFLLVYKDVDDHGYGLAVTWAVLPVTFFAASFILGRRGWFGKMKWLAAPVFGAMYAMSGYTASVTAEGIVMRSVIWPDFAKLPVGLLISIVGLAIGVLVKKSSGRG